MEKEKSKIKNQKEKLTINKKEEKKEAKAIVRFIHMTPRKLRLVLNVIRGKNALSALSILKFIPKRASRPLEKILKSAIANAENNLKLNSDKLFISQAYVDQGPTMKRFMPRAMGRASLIHKRTSHITIVVSEKT